MRASISLPLSLLLTLSACPRGAPGPEAADAAPPAGREPGPLTRPAETAPASPALAKRARQPSFDPESEVLTRNGQAAIDERAVSGIEYSRCVDDGVCARPSYDRYNREPDYRHEPAMSLNWHMARTYCDHVGKRLPTLEEYEQSWRQLRWLGCCARNAIPREWAADEPDTPRAPQVRKVKGRLRILTKKKNVGVDSSTVRCARDLVAP